jgi:sulfate permease, SulP family
VSAIVIVAASQMIEWRSLYFMYKIRAWKELFLCLIMFAISFTFGPQVGIISFLVISIFLVVKHTTMPHVALLGRVGKTRKYRDMAMFSGIAKPIPVSAFGSHKRAVVCVCVC